MCVAGLNVSTQSCAHRWYELIRPCNPANNLQNCTERVKLEGWEKRNEHCPFCDGGNHHQSTHRLFGSTSSASSVVSSPVASDMGITRTGRRGSGATLTGTLSPLSRTSSNNSVDAIELERATRARDMNDRLHVYLSCDPHEVLPSAKKNYPTYSSAIQRAEEAAVTTSSDSHSGRKTLIRRQSFTRGWKRMSNRFSISSTSEFLRIFE